MAATAFKPLSWSNFDPVTSDRLQVMADNDQYLMDNKMGGDYNAYSTRRNIGVKMAGGLALITARKANTADVDVRFNNFFSEACHPLVTTGIVSVSQRRITPTIDGLGTTHPDYRGFQLHVFVDADANKNRKITKNFWVSWHALGF